MLHLELDLAGRRERLALVAAGPLRESAGGEVGNVDVTLDNPRGQHTALFDPPPLGLEARIVRGAEVLFAGRVFRVRLGVQIGVEIEA